MSQWGLTWIYPALIVILIMAYSVWLGPSRALRYAAVGIFSMFFVYQFKSATALAYQHPDVPDRDGHLRADFSRRDAHREGAERLL